MWNIAREFVILNLKSKCMDSLLLKELWVKRHKRFIYFANSIVENMPEAEDIVVECYLRINKENKIVEKEYLYAKLVIYVKNMCRDYLRKKSRVEKSQKEILHLSSEIEEKVSYAFLEAELIGTVYEIIEQMKGRRGEVAKLKYLQNMTINEISERLNMTLSAIDFNAFKARQYINRECRKMKLFPITK